MKYQDYRIIEELGRGGNATVSLAETPEGSQVAIKELIIKSFEKTKRFKNEINILLKASNEKIDGVMPIYDYSKRKCWYTMPKTTPVVDHIKKYGLSLYQIINYFIELCYTINELHGNGISHRDIKPDNIHFYNERFYLGDFGLVDFPDNNNNLTRSNRKLGAIFTIAPEMLRNPKKADGKKADIYSLAKTLWMLLSLDEKGFDGQYNYFDKTHALNTVPILKGTHIVEIEELLRDSTNNNPDDRPTIEEFIERLLNWKSVASDFSKRQKSQWAFLYKHILNGSGESVTWRNRIEIIKILNKISSLNAYNHMLYPDSGGQDFVSANSSPEADGIELWDDAHTCNIVFPKALHFEAFPGHEEWNYFILELKDVEKKFDSHCLYEALVEDTPGHYVLPTNYQYGVYDYETGNKYPEGYRLVSRYTGGKFLFVLKTGPYNHINATYDGRHNDCSCDQFREYIDYIIHRCVEKGFDFLNSSYLNVNPFKMDEKVHDSRSKSKKEVISKSSVFCDDYRSFRYDITDLNEEYENEYAKYYISFHPIRILIYDLKEIRLCTDGILHELENDDFDDVLFFNDREYAHKIMKCCKEQLFKGEDGKKFGCFSVNIIGKSKPEHLFSKDEIETIMREADDRNHNTLVIDEEGYARIISNGELDVNSFPVHLERWNAGNMYVGKYSNLSTLQETYLSSLQGWIHYLQSKRSVYVDGIYETNDEKELITEIERIQ